MGCEAATYTGDDRDQVTAAGKGRLRRQWATGLGRLGRRASWVRHGGHLGRG